MDNLLLLGHNVIHCSFRYIEDCLTKQEALEILRRNEKFKAEREEKVRVSGKYLFSKFSKMYLINNLAYFDYDADKKFQGFQHTPQQLDGWDIQKRKLST